MIKVLYGMGKFKTSQEIYDNYQIESTWTIDLSFILKQYDIEDFVFYTTHLGINWEHVKVPFYSVSYENDKRRVHSLFSEAQGLGMNIIPRKVTIEEMREFMMTNRYAIILLVDLNLLSCQLCKEKQRKEYWKSWWRMPVSTGGIQTQTPTVSMHDQSQSTQSSQYHPQLPAQASTPLLNPTSASLPVEDNSGCLGVCKWFTKRGLDMVKVGDFVGHYIVIIGWDRDTDMFFYRDPGTYESDTFKIETMDFF